MMSRREVRRGVICVGLYVVVWYESRCIMYCIVYYVEVYIVVCIVVYYLG